MAPAPRVAGRQRRQWLGPALALALGLGLAAAAAAAAVEVTGHLEVNPPDFVRDLEDALPAGHALDEDHQHICQLADGGGRVDCYPRVFQPTDEFQLVRPGQLLPHGLHVKVDMATGERYGKRLSANEPGDAADALDLVVAPVETGKPAPGASAEEDGSGGVAPLTPERKAELDALWEQLMALARQETEQLLAVLQTLRDPEATSAALLGALHTMEDIVHQIDYGRDLVAMEGLEPIVRLLDHADAAVRAQVATVLGSALQRYAQRRVGPAPVPGSASTDRALPPPSFSWTTTAIRTCSRRCASDSASWSASWRTCAPRRSRPTSSGCSSRSARWCAATPPTRATLCTTPACSCWRRSFTTSAPRPTSAAAA